MVARFISTHYHGLLFNVPRRSNATLLNLSSAKNEYYAGYQDPKQG